MHIATRFECAAYLPLFPLGTVVVLEDEDGNATGMIPAPWCGWSVVMGVFRGWCGGLAVVCLLFGWLFAQGPRSPEREIGIVMLCLVPVLIGAAITTLRVPRLKWASYERAVQVAESAKVPASVRVNIDVAFGLLTEEEGMRLITASHFDGTEGLGRLLLLPPCHPAAPS